MHNELKPENVYKHYIHVQPEDIDELNHVNNVVYLRYVQEAAASHWDSIAPLNFKASYSWVVLRHEIDYKNPAVLGDSIQAETWVTTCEGVRSERHVELRNSATGILLAKAKTIWCLLDAQSMKPKRIEQEISKLFFPE